MTAENLIAMLLGMEVASGNDALASHSEIRKAAKLMLQFIPGTDFITSGYGAIPRPDNMFGGGNFDVTELDDWYVLQRDMRVDGGITPVTEERVLEARARAAGALQTVFRTLEFPPITDDEIAAATGAYGSEDMPDRDRVADIEEAQRLQHGPLTVLDVIAALDAGGFAEIAANILEMQRQRVIGDYLQPSAVFDDRFRVRSALTDPNDYRGPGTGYRVEGERWAALQDLPQAWEPRTWLESLGAGHAATWLEEAGPALPGKGMEVVIAVGPAFGHALTRTIGGLDHRDVLQAIVGGLQEEHVAARIVRMSAHLRLRVHWPRGRAVERFGDRDRPAVERHHGDPPPRPHAARQPRAFRDGPEHGPRDLPADRAQCGAARAGQAGRADSGAQRQHRAPAAHRADDAAAPARDTGGAARTAAGGAAPYRRCGEPRGSAMSFWMCTLRRGIDRIGLKRRRHHG